MMFCPAGREPFEAAMDDGFGEGAGAIGGEEGRET
jgi:hypothetical protein